MTIVTYGGGEVLFHLFTGIKMLFESNFIKVLSFLMASISVVYVIITSYFSTNPDSFIKQFFLPLCALVVLCFSIKTTVYIEDVLPLTQGGINILSREALSEQNGSVGHEINSSWTVDKVPFFIGFLSKGISTLGHKLTVAVESIFHSVDDPKYTKTGMIFGAETALDMNEIVINDGNLDANLRTFCRNCMLYDLALNLYTIQDLKNNTHLLDFLKEKTAKSRFMNYQSSEEGKNKTSELISCQDAIYRIAEKLEKGGVELAHQEQKQIFRHLPIAYQALTKHSGDHKEIMQQMLAMSVISEELSSESFAAKRAALQQKTTWKTMGGIADSLVVTTRCVIEALIYGAIIFVIPLMFLPSGFSYLKNWVWLLVWIQLWPPFYAILDYISLIAARGQAEGLFNAESANTCCLTLYNTLGLSTIYGNISAYAKSMKILIPPLSYAILQGGVGSFVHLTSSMMGASQNAASMAGSDQVSGNYSFANTSMNTSSFSNATYGQQNFSPSLNSGYVRNDDITGVKTYGFSESTYDERFSKLSRGFSTDKAIQSSLSKTLTNSQTAHESSSLSLSSSISNVGRSSMDYTSHLAYDSSYSSSHATSETQEASKSAQFCANQVETFAKDHNISTQSAWEIFGSVGGGLGLKAFNAGANVRHGRVGSDTWNDAISISESKDFREAYNQVINHADNFSHNQTDGEGYRLAESFTSSIDNLNSSSESFSTTLDQVNQASQANSYFENLSLSERSDLSQQVIDFAIQEKGYTFNQAADLFHSEHSPQAESLIHEFTQSRVPEFQKPENYLDPEDVYSNSRNDFLNSSANLNEIDQKHLHTNMQHNFNREKTSEVKQKLSDTSFQSLQLEQFHEEIINKREELKISYPMSQPEQKIQDRRELDLEVSWAESFDDDFLPVFYHKG